MCEHLIDCHVLTLPRFHSAWVDELHCDLNREPVNQHWLPGIDGDLAAARVAGFSLGCAPFVSSADPDDRILPGTFAALLQALQDCPGAPFAWAGEQMVREDLSHFRAPHIWPGGYDPIRHVGAGTHVHGVKLYRRELVIPLLDSMLQAGPCCEFLLDLAIIKPWTNPPRSSYPVHLPTVGRLWRLHGENGSWKISTDDFDRMARVLGFGTMQELRASVAHIAQSTNHRDQ